MKAAIQTYKDLEEQKKSTNEIVSKIASGINEAVDEASFYSLNIHQINNIFKSSKNLEMSKAKIAVKNIMDTYNENGLSVLKFINCWKNESDVTELLQELYEIPLMKEISKIIQEKNSIIERQKQTLEGNSSDICVDWEKQFRVEEELYNNQKSILDKLINKHNAICKIIQKRAPRPRPFEKKEWKNIGKCFESKDIKGAEKIFKKDSSLIFIKNQENRDETLLHNAIKNKWIDGINLIHEVGIGVDGILDIPNGSGICPLSYAYLNNQIDIAKLLISKGANLEIRDINSETILIDACKKDNDSFVEYLVSNGANKEAIDSNNKTALAVAIQERAFKVARYLIIAGANIYVNGIMDIAIDSNNEEIIKLIISKVTDVNKIDENGITPLMKVAEKCNINIVDYTLKKSKFEFKNEYGETALLRAAANKNKGIYEKLLSASMESNINNVDNFGNNALLTASFHGNVNTIEFLLSQGIDIESRNAKEETALMKACYGGKLDAVMFLIEKGANIEAKDCRQETPLMKAVIANRDNVVKYLLQKGADVEAVDSQGRTPILRAACFGNANTMKALISGGANMEIRLNSETPLARACYAGNVNAVKVLVLSSANINAVDSNGETPLLMAAYRGHLDIVQFLNEKGADINAYNNFGETALMKAASNGKLNVVKYLADKVKDVDEMSHYGKSAVLLAEKNGHKEVAKFLITKGAIGSDMSMYLLSNVKH